jgi:hypothetical protein
VREEKGRKGEEGRSKGKEGRGEGRGRGEWWKIKWNGKFFIIGRFFTSLPLLLFSSPSLCCSSFIPLSF